MAEHYTKNTMAVSAWCSKCRKNTMHRVDGGRKGPCEQCLKTLEKATPDAPAAVQERMFG